MRTRSIVVAAAATCLALMSNPAAQDVSILTAMQAELARSMTELRMKDEPPPYYISYRVDDEWSSNVVGTLGAVVQDHASRRRTLQVEVRVGDYAFDSSRFFSSGGSSGPTTTILPLDDDVDAIRRGVWLATDAAYKRALNVFSRKKAAFQNRPAGERILDFSRETPVEKTLPPVAPASGAPQWSDAVRRISAAFVQQPAVHASDVVFTESHGMRYFLNSEGFKIVAPIQAVSVRTLAETLAVDGTTLRGFFTAVGGSPQELPSATDLVERARALAGSLTDIRSAPAGDVYTGPVLVEDQAAAELLLQTLVPLFLSRRPPDSDDPRMATAVEAMTTPYLSRIGSRVLPDGFSASDTPSMTRQGNTPIPGAYIVDDEGIAAKDVTLVENGILLTLLSGRTPQKNLPQSNGHARGGSVQAGVFQLRSAKAVRSAELRQKYLDLLKQQGKPFGYIVRVLANPGAVQPATFESGEPVTVGAPGPGGTASSIQILRAIRVTADGKEQEVRGIQFGPVPHTAFRSILEASEERTVYSTRVGAGSVASLLVPDLIFEELEIQKARGGAQKAPVVPSPLKR
jgi:hypothetical protein